MAEDLETEKKPNFVLNKQTQTQAKAAPAQAAVKKRVVVKKKPVSETQKTGAETGNPETAKSSAAGENSKVRTSQAEVQTVKKVKAVKAVAVQQKKEAKETKEEDSASSVQQETAAETSRVSEDTSAKKESLKAPLQQEQGNPEKTSSEKTGGGKPKKEEKQSVSVKSEKKAETVKVIKRTVIEPVKRSAESLDYMSRRPNVKAGNLSDGHRGGFRGGNFGERGERYGNNSDGRGGFNRFQGGQRGNRDGQRGGDGFQNRKPFGDRKFGQRSFGAAGKTGDKKSFGFGLQNQRNIPSPIPMEQSKTSKKGHKAKKAVYSRKSKDEDLFEEKQLQQKKKARGSVNSVPSEIEILESISISELAKKMNLRASELIGKLMENGMMVTLNQSIDAETAELLASEYDCKVKVISLYDETVIERESDEGAELMIRPPVVTIMGHVDHGKTKTLDAIRSTNVAAGEFGGITQHIGAYTVSTPGGRITFLDTPGHEAFTMMRARGAEITDIVVLVVAADDGVMPQTIEAINHAKDAKVPIIVAVNKIDKPEANPDKVKTRLSELGLMPEDWGGDTMYVEISALQKLGIEELLEAILLNAEVLELKVNYNCHAEGKVIESKIDHGRGVVATIIVQRGTLREGDPYVAGIYSGRVRAIFNDRGERISEASPSMPVEILGLEGMPNAGDPFQVTDSEKLARQISSKRQELKRFEDSRNVKKVTLDNLYETIHDGEILELKVIIKGDVQGSVEALKQSLEKLSTKEVRLNVIHASAGAINDSDVMLAAADSNALIIGFNVRPTPQAKLLAEQEKVDIRKYTVIYKAVEEIQMAMEGLLSPDLKEEVVGTAEVRNVFKVPKVGNVAGIYVLDGFVKRNCLVNVIRDGIVIHNSGKVSSLKRFQDDAKEVAAGFECGLGIENFNDIKIGDQLEIIQIKEVARKLSDTEKYEAPEIKGQ